jgi:hypothetical protein
LIVARALLRAVPRLIAARGRLTVIAVLAVGLNTAAEARITHVLWQDPGDVAHLDFRYGAGGSAAHPRPPFRFVKEDEEGSSPKVTVRDADGRLWSVKWGPEVKAEVIASRLAWATGYFAEPSFFIRNGRISGARKLGRASGYIDARGRFTNARFELRPRYPRYLDGNSWNWRRNPFAGRPELNGLKIMTMLLSNWDNKDSRDLGRGANTGVYQEGSGKNLRWRYLVTDWGAAMGGWGSFLTRDKWDCDEFREQNNQFVRGTDDGYVEFGYRGQHTEMRERIRPSDVRWLLRYLGRITDAQLRAGLVSSGASPHEIECFTRSLRMRINALRRVARARA